MFGWLPLLTIILVRSQMDLETTSGTSASRFEILVDGLSLSPQEKVQRPMNQDGKLKK